MKLFKHKNTVILANEVINGRIYGFCICSNYKERIGVFGAYDRCYYKTINELVITNINDHTGICFYTDSTGNILITNSNTFRTTSVIINKKDNIASSIGNGHARYIINGRSLIKLKKIKFRERLQKV